MTVNGHKYEPKPCAKRLPDGYGWCVLDDNHIGQCEASGPPRYDYPQKEIDHHLMARPKLSKPATPASEVVWPALGARFQDSDGRTLTITEINPTSPIDRHIVGLLGDGLGYACSRIVFDAIWREAR